MSMFRIVSLCLTASLALALPACNKGADRIKVAFISNNAYDFWKIAQRGTEKAAKEFNVDCDFRMPSGGGSVEEQQRIIEDLLTKGVKGIAISPNAAADQVEFFKEKVAPRVPLITQDSDVPDPTARRAYIGTNNYRAGRAAGALVKKALPDGGKVVIYVGKLDVQNAVERRQGVLDELAGKPGDTMGPQDPNEKNIKVGKYVVLDTRTDDGKREVCQQRVEETLTMHPDVGCLVGLWEYNPPAIIQAVQATKNEHKPAIVGFDENEETLEAIRKGICFGTIVQDPFNFGYESVKILAGLARGDESVLKGRKDIDSQNRIYVPHRVIMRAEVDRFQEELHKLKGG
jgi:ribose transport system substrate-binding protein